MIGSTRQVAVWAYGTAADLRKGFDGLSALVSQGLGRDPLSGDCYLFVNATRKRAKVLLWDGTGLCIYAHFGHRDQLDRRIVTTPIGGS